mmetsp:Transcript_4949/g.7651  ORF Transcript_4949/g.7651 Transcript_4949/m.7651 type:complete len:563 (+) Transcript_4949:123-1811(+)
MGRAKFIDQEAKRPLLEKEDDDIVPFKIQWKRIWFNADWPWGVAFATLVLLTFVIQARMILQGAAANDGEVEWKELKSNVGGPVIWGYLRRHPDIPLVLSCGILSLGVLWVWLLQRYSRATIWGASIVKCLFFISLSMSFSGILGGVCIPIVVALIATMIYKYKEINYAAAFLQQSCVCLRHHWGIWFASLGVQAGYWVVLLFYIKAQMYQSKRNYDPYGKTKRVLSSLMLAWMTYYLKQVKLMVASVSTVSWYFPTNMTMAKEASKILTHPSIIALKWAMSASLGTLSLGGLSLALTDFFYKQSMVRLCLSTACGCLQQVLGLCCMLCAKSTQVASRYAIIAHSVSSKSFFRSGLSANRMLSNRKVQLIVSQEFGETVVSVFAYSMGLLSGVVTLIWVDVSEDFGSLPLTFCSYSWAWQAVIDAFLVIFYLVTIYYPLTTLTVLSILTGQLEYKSAPVFMGLFVAALAHLVFLFMAEVILDSTNAILFCYAIETNNTMRPKNGISSENNKAATNGSENNTYPTEIMMGSMRANDETVDFANFIRNANPGVASAPLWEETTA